MDAKNKRWLNRNLIGFSLASFFNDVSYEMIITLLPTFLTQLTGSSAPLFAGILGGLSEGIASVTKFISGMLSDRLNIRKPFIALGYGIGSLCNGLISFASSVWHVIFFQTLSRVGKGLRDPARDALLSTSVSPAYYGRSFGFNRAMDTLGAILGPLIVVVALGHVNVRSIILWSAVPGILAVASILFFVKEQQVKKTILSSFSLQDSFKQLPPSFIFFLIILALFNMGSFHITLLILRAQQLLPVSALSAETLSIVLYIGFNIIQAISEYSFGWLSDSGGRKYFLSLCGFGLFGIACLLLAFSSSFFGVAIAFMVSGMSIGTTGALTKSYAAELLPPAIRGLGYGALQAVDGTAKLIASFVVGALWTYVSPQVGFTYAAVTSFSAALLLGIGRK